MRALRRSLFVLAPFSVAALGVFACEEESPPPAQYDFPEAGGIDTNQPPPNDANPIPDSPADTTPKPTTVSVTVSGRTGPKASVTIVFHDADGAVLETKTTGADGKATSSTATPPSMATALVGTPQTKHLVTWTGLEGGDALLLRDVDDVPFLGNFAVTLPGIFTDAGAVSHDAVSGDCSSESNQPGDQPIQIPLYASCVRATSSVLATARDEGSTVVGYSFKKGNIAPSDGGDVPITTGEWKAPGTTTLIASGVPATGTTTVRLLEISDGFGYDNRITTGTDDASTPFQTVQGFADALQGNVIRRTGAAIGGVAKRQAPAATLTVDFTQVLPSISTVTKTVTDARRPVINWTSAAPLTATDGGIVRVRFTGPDVEALYNWTFVVGPNATSVKAPALPAAADTWLPEADAGAGAFGLREPEVVFIETDLLPGYVAFRAQQGILLGIQAAGSGRVSGLSIPMLPQNGTLRATAFQEIPQ